MHANGSRHARTSYPKSIDRAVQEPSTYPFTPVEAIEAMKAR